MARYLWHMTAALVLTGCAGFGPSDPLEDVPRLSDLEISADAGEAQIAAPLDQPGFFAGLFSGGQDDTEATPEVESASAGGSLFSGLFGGGDDAEPEAESPESGGLLSRIGFGQAEARAPTEPEPGTVPPGTIMPFGEVGRTCGMSRASLGTRIYAASGYAIYDSAPNTTAARPHYITGFRDNCVRQFTAALVLNGDVGTHEVVRYQTAQSRGPYTAVDNAYETLKAQVCGAGRGQPCGRQIDRLARNTTFITGYQRFTSSPTWVELLLHNGEVLAVGVESK